MSSENRSEQFGLPWYAGVNISSRRTFGNEADALCSKYIELLFTTPQSRAVELILETLERRHDARMLARCLSDAMSYIAHTPINRIKDQLAREYGNPDYATTHDFDHTREELREALHMSPEEFEAALKMVTLISGELFKKSLKKSLEVKIEPARVVPVFEKMLRSAEWSDLQKATALYLFLAMPIQNELAALEALGAQLAGEHARD